MTTAPHVAPTATMLPLRTPRTPERIVLTGFMGSGKSTVGVLLAAELGWSFIDLDSEIERRTGLNVPQMFAEKGEAAFRKEETAALAAALGCTHAIIALGGGAPETLANRLLLEQTPATTVVYLTAPLVTLAQRCAAQDVLAASPGSTFRPNFADPIAAESKFIARQPIYRRLAHISLETGNLTPEGTVAALLTAVAAKAARA